MTDAYTRAVLTVIALALVVLAVRPIIEPGRVDAQGPNVRGQSGREGTDAAFELLSRRVDKLEHNPRSYAPRATRTHIGRMYGSRVPAGASTSSSSTRTP